MKRLLEEDVLEIVEQQLVLSIEASIYAELVPLLHTDNPQSFPFFVHMTHEHVMKCRQSVGPLVELIQELTDSQELSNSLQRIYRTSLEYAEHTNIAQIAQNFYLLAYTVCTNSGQTDRDQGIESTAFLGDC